MSQDFQNEMDKWDRYEPKRKPTAEQIRRMARALKVGGAQIVEPEKDKRPNYEPD